MLQNLSFVAVVIGALRVHLRLVCLYKRVGYHEYVFTKTCMINLMQIFPVDMSSKDYQGSFWCVETKAASM